MRADARVGGHFVQGHVDATGRIDEIRHEADFHRVELTFPASLAPYLVRKGSVAVDGISLTVAGLSDTRFDVQIVPFTWDHTNLSKVTTGAVVNLECDIIGKYVCACDGGGGVRAGPLARGQHAVARVMRRPHVAADASRPATLLVGRILPACSLLAPCRAGASTPSVYGRMYNTDH